ncbi:MAG TPA: glycosyltransferase, partial [Chthoniobacterales bacterium]|nr:glycosyltransferase [Chthoniobacterales bacterium]
ETLPKRPNLHWLGGRDYSLLPAYVKRFDVCLMPFALNEATEFINPTKALEYMASGRPIVSTPVEDVVLQFDQIVDVASTVEEFIAACTRAVTAPDQSRIKAGLKRARQHSWESIVAQLEKHIDDVIASKQAVATTAA